MSPEESQENVDSGLSERLNRDLVCRSILHTPPGTSPPRGYAGDDGSGARPKDRRHGLQRGARDLDEGELDSDPESEFSRPGSQVSTVPRGRSRTRARIPPSSTFTRYREDVDRGRYEMPHGVSVVEIKTLVGNLRIMSMENLVILMMIILRVYVTVIHMVFKVDAIMTVKVKVSEVT